MIYEVQFILHLHSMKDISQILTTSTEETIGFRKNNNKHQKVL